VVHPRETFKAAILANAAALVVGHNHLSGDVQPSMEDRAITKRLVEAGKLLGIEVLDHIIIGTGGVYFSFADENMLS
jgi:DNA repair protein RadC